MTELKNNKFEKNYSFIEYRGHWDCKTKTFMHKKSLLSIRLKISNFIIYNPVKTL